jgi:hypothetical protein
MTGNVSSTRSSSLIFESLNLQSEMQRLAFALDNFSYKLLIRESGYVISETSEQQLTGGS